MTKVWLILNGKGVRGNPRLFHATPVTKGRRPNPANLSGRRVFGEGAKTKSGAVANLASTLGVEADSLNVVGEFIGPKA